jgi:hypothetical protein
MMDDKLLGLEISLPIKSIGIEMTNNEMWNIRYFLKIDFVVLKSRNRNDK